MSVRPLRKVFDAMIVTDVAEELIRLKVAVEADVAERNSTAVCPLLGVTKEFCAKTSDEKNKIKSDKINIFIFIFRFYSFAKRIVIAPEVIVAASSFRIEMRVPAFK